MFSSFRSRGLILGLLLAALVIPGSTSLAGAARWAVAGFASFNTYTMSDVNDEIGSINSLLSGTGISPMDEVKSGLGFGGGVRAIFNDQVWVSVDYERLTGSTSLSDGADKLEYDVPGNAVLASVAYRFPGTGKARFGIGGGLGYYSSAASLSIDAPSVALSEEWDVSGSGIGFHAFGLLDAALSEAVHFEALTGYRFGQTGDVEIEGPGVPTQTLTDYKLDWNGLMVRGGLAFHFGPSR